MSTRPSPRDGKDRDCGNRNSPWCYAQATQHVHSLHTETRFRSTSGDRLADDSHTWPSQPAGHFDRSTERESPLGEAFARPPLAKRDRPRFAALLGFQEAPRLPRQNIPQASLSQARGKAAAKLLFVRLGEANRRESQAIRRRACRRPAKLGSGVRSHQKSLRRWQRRNEP